MPWTTAANGSIFVHVSERVIVPALGAVILLSSFILGVPLIYQLLLALLGLAAAGTYAAPPRVQVETRIVIAAAGLIILLIVSSTAFWLTLLSFGAIAALQIPHRHTLQRQPATVAWLGTLLDAARERRSVRVDGAASTVAPDDETRATTSDGEGEVAPARPASRPPGAPGIDLPGFVRVSAAGVCGPIAGVLVVVGLFMPWVGFLFSGFGETMDGPNLTLRAAASELELPALSGFFGVLLALAAASIVSIALPRVAAAIVAATGLGVTVASYLYVVVEVERGAAELSSMGVSVVAFPLWGALLAGLCFAAMLVLQFLPGANRA